MESRTGRIETDERSGVLRPANLERFSAEWIAPAAAVRDVVDTYWAVRWNLGTGESVAQRIVDFPAVTLSVEAGDVRAPFMVTAARREAWERTIAGAGSVFALRLRPAGLAVLTDLDPESLDGEQPLTAAVDPRAHHLLRTIAKERSTEARARCADATIAELLLERSLTRTQSLANAAVDALTSSPLVRAGTTVADELGTTQRSLQRALRSTLGIGPSGVARRIRLQEVIRRLSMPSPDIGRIAADLGYADQAHMINDFRGVAGVTPGQYVRDLQQTQSDLRG